MGAHLTRRDVLKLVGGSAVGFFFTPVPWKLLDDSSIWTQNWSMIPPLPRGDLTAQFSACTLCSAGCAVKAKCVGKMPYGLAGVPGHPLSRGYICAQGLAGHHMAYHPLRLGTPVRFDGAGDAGRMVPISGEAAMRTAADKLRETGGSVALLDCQPGRAISAFYEDFVRLQKDGIYLTDATREDATLSALQSMMEDKTAPLGFDFESASLILSFGAPLLDGWGAPGRLKELFMYRPTRPFRLVQVESRQSRTALQADRWVPATPGGERAFALSLANVLLEEHLDRAMLEKTVVGVSSYRAVVASYTPEAACEESGIDPSVVRQIAEELSRAPAAIVLSGADPGGGPLPHATEHAVAGLNLLLGSVGKKGGVVFRHAMPGKSDRVGLVRDIRDVPDHSLRLLIIDAASSGYAIPWASLERKLCPGTGIVVSLSPYMDAIAAHSDIVIPAPAPYESLQDIPTHAGALAAAFSLSARLLPANERALEPADVVARISAMAGLPLTAPTGDSLLRERALAIYAERRGTLYEPADGSTVRIADLSSSDDLWTKFNGGAVWVDDQMDEHRPGRATLSTEIVRLPKESVPAVDGLVLAPFGWKRAVSGYAVPPIMSKLYQESALRPGAGTISLHPSTAARSGVADADRVILETAGGAMEMNLRVDRSVRPGVAEAAAGPSPQAAGSTGRGDLDILDLCDVRDDGTWRLSNANVRKA